MKGKFITFEGPEGAGKSTLIRKIAKQLETMDYEIFLTREPGGTPTGEAIRAILQHDYSGEEIYPRAELLLFEASRAQLVGKVIKPKLEEGVWVLCDRFIYSTTAYQWYGRGFDIRQIEELNYFAIKGCVPDLTLLLDLPVEVGLERTSKRRNESGEIQKPDRFEKEVLDFHKRVREGYLDIAKRDYKRVKVINADQEEDKVYLEASRVLFERLGL